MSTTISSVGVSASNTVSFRTATSAPANTDEAVPQEKVELNQGSDDALTYAKPRAVPPDLQTLLDQSEEKVNQLMNLIRPLLEQQGLNLSKVVTGEQKLTADPATINAAKQAISEDGEFGVKKVSERILSFAKFATGGDPAKLDKIRAAVEQGFASAKEALGGVLPEISQKTYDTIMGEFDRWAKEGIPSGDTVTLGKPADTTKDASKV